MRAFEGDRLLVGWTEDMGRYKHCKGRVKCSLFQIYGKIFGIGSVEGGYNLLFRLAMGVRPYIPLAEKGEFTFGCGNVFDIVP